ncbi:MAG: sugar ABC transporter permease [Anaerolineae bacterium]|nr:sugar ABC transporter permease [Anaerolineae bacterium]
MRADQRACRRVTFQRSPDTCLPGTPPDRQVCPSLGGKAANHDQQRRHNADQCAPPAPRFHLNSDLRLALLFILPAVVLVAVLMYYPMGRVVKESLYKTPKTAWLDPNPPQVYVGLEHYEKLVNNAVFEQILTNSLYWTIGVVFFQNLIGLATALLLDQKLPMRGAMRALVLLPWVLPGVVNAILWRFMYDPQLGLINSILIGTGLTSEKTAWLAQTDTALGALIIAAIWKGFPFSTVMYLAALQSVDHEQLEAAQIDGASAPQRFRHVTIPAISGIMRLNLLLTTIWTFNYFDLIWVTTAGGPLKRTHIFPRSSTRRPSASPAILAGRRPTV